MSLLSEVRRALSGHVLDPESLVGDHRVRFVQGREAFESYLSGELSDEYLEAIFRSLKKPADYRVRSIAPYHLAVHKLFRIQEAVKANIAAIAALEPEPVVNLPPPRSGWVYFVECGGYIKIGFTTDIAGRLAGLETGTPHPVKLLRQEPGTLSTEAAYHERFSGQRVKREWFSYEGTLKDFLESLE